MDRLDMTKFDLFSPFSGHLDTPLSSTHQVSQNLQGLYCIGNLPPSLKTGLQLAK